MKLFLFDIDGTILTSGAGRRALAAGARAYFGPEADINGIEIAGRTDKLIAIQLLEKLGRPVTEAAIAGFLDQYLHQLALHLPNYEREVLPGILPLLETLRMRPNVELGLLTGNLEKGAKLKLDHAGVWHFFGFGAFADDSHERDELGPHALRRANKRSDHEFDPDSVFVIGDTPHDVQCARAIDAKAVAVATGKYSREELAQCEPDFLFDDLSDVRGVLEQLGLPV